MQLILSNITVLFFLSFDSIIITFTFISEDHEITFFQAQRLQFRLRGASKTCPWFINEIRCENIFTEFTESVRSVSFDPSFRIKAYIEIKVIIVWNPKVLRAECYIKGMNRVYCDRMEWGKESSFSFLLDVLSVSWPILYWIPSTFSCVAVFIRGHHCIYTFLSPSYDCYICS